ncbi:hypothetical protein OIE62_40545 [Streptomyces scopuliridis]|uniref:Uncharacterized protein n=1 Tax=Streptomyces scopuliridis TaxID=452529 RepID=A0ACD4ZBZ8_9ACTN|nr:hypothetical protein [Streptomyces scopuliridis]WSB95644.1 hypothetical protein OG835_00375 [Streptomyces scopuliridis]WSC10647.1 hypothetical protein OIE62_40545 [Streptomyces scopuliridis]
MEFPSDAQELLSGLINVSYDRLDQPRGDVHGRLDDQVQLAVVPRTGSRLS